MRNRKDMKGVTLTVLVITVIILLILAGISIAAFKGDKGLLNETKNMKNDIEDLQNKTIDDLHQIANELASSTGDALNPDNPSNPSNPNPPTPEVPKDPVEVPIENIKSDWLEIDKIAQEIAKDDSITSNSEKATVTVDDKIYTITVGDFFEVEYNGEKRRVRVLGFKHDDLVNTGAYGGNHSKAGISFEFYDLMTGNTYMQMNTSNTNSGGWGSTKLRTDLNGSGSSIGGLGAKLSNKEYIKQVKKKYIATRNDASSVTTCNDYLWLLASSEVAKDGCQSGYYGNAITSEGSQYKYYQGATESWNVSSTNRVKYNASGSANWWWLRSPYYNHTTYFCGVGNNGDMNSSNTASTSRGVAPGFCI